MNPSALPDAFECEVSALVQQQQLERCERERSWQLRRLALCLEHALAPLPPALRRQVTLAAASPDGRLIRLEIASNAYDLRVANSVDYFGNDWTLRHAALHLSEPIRSLEGFSRVAAAAVHARGLRARAWQWPVGAAVAALLTYGAWRLLVELAGQSSYAVVLGILSVLALIAMLAIADVFTEVWLPKPTVPTAPGELQREAFSAWQARAFDPSEAP